jgi:flavodoxin
MKTLVIFYSRTGFTKKIAEEIAKKLDAEIEQIKDLRNRKGFFGFLISGYEAVTKKLAKIAQIEKNPTQYDLIVVSSEV